MLILIIIPIKKTKHQKKKKTHVTKHSHNNYSIKERIPRTKFKIKNLMRERNPPTSVKDMNLVSLGILLAITSKHIQKLPTSNGVTGMAPPLAGPTSLLHCFAHLPFFPPHFTLFFLGFFCSLTSVKKCKIAEETRSCSCSFSN